MKVLAALGTILLLQSASCGFISSPALLRTPALDSTIVRSNQVGGNFAYSTSENHGYAPVSPLSYQIQQPIYSHQPIFAQQPVYSHQLVHSQPLYPQQFLGHSVVTSPLYSGLYHQPVFAQNQFLSQEPTLAWQQLPSTTQLLQSQGPLVIQGAAPVQGQVPVQGQAPAGQPTAPSQSQGDPPAPGATFDDDTVSVESA